MNAGEAKVEVQAVLGLPQVKRAPNIGPLTRAAFEQLAITPDDAAWPPPVGDMSLAKPGERGARDINAAAVDLIKHFESLKVLRPDGLVEAYWDALGKCWTIGWGHTGLQHKDGTVYRGRTITQAKAEQLFRYDMDQFEARVERQVKVALNDDEHGALVSFDFNTGGLTLADGKPSTLVRKLNMGDREAAAAEFLKWDNSGGQRDVPGLQRRRWSERRLFLGQHPAIIPTMAALRRVQAGQPV